MKYIAEKDLFEEGKWEPQSVLPLRNRQPEDPLLHWVSIWFAACNLLSDAEEHPDHWDIKYEGLTKQHVIEVRNECEKEWRSLWPSRESSPNLEAVLGIVRRFVGFKSFDPPEGL